MENEEFKEEYVRNMHLVDVWIYYFSMMNDGEFEANKEFVTIWGFEPSEEVPTPKFDCKVEQL